MPKIQCFGESTHATIPEEQQQEEEDYSAIVGSDFKKNSIITRLETYWGRTVREPI